MSRHNTELVRQRLLQLKAELESLKQDSHEKARPVELDQSKVGRLSRMDAMQEQQMFKETERRREIQLQKIAGALRRLDAGDYGVCFVCGDEIDSKRLEVDPTHTRCIDCVE